MKFIVIIIIIIIMIIIIIIISGLMFNDTLHASNLQVRTTAILILMITRFYKL
jgi:hypothetical protein